MRDLSDGVLTLIPIPTVPILTDKLAASIVGGVIAGYGCGMTLQNGGCGGGQDILGLYFMQKDRNFSVGKISMMINIAVFTACALMYDLSTVIYSLIYVAVYNFVTDYTHAQNRNVAAIIITSREDVMPAIRASIDRTATSWEGTGSFAGKSIRSCIWSCLSTRLWNCAISSRKRIPGPL